MSYPMWNEAKTGILVDRGNGVLRFLESGPEFERQKATAADWHEAEISKPDPSIRRARMRCRPASLRLALHRAGRLAEAEAIAAADPEAAIVWEYMTTAERMSPLIQAMAGDAFTDEEIDGLFETAMAIEAAASR